MFRGGAEVAGGDNVAGVVDRFAIQADVTGGIAGVVRVDARLDSAAVGQLTATAQCNAVTSGQDLLVLEAATGLHVCRSTGVDRVLCIKAGSIDVDGAAGGRLGHGQMAVGVDLHIAAAGSHIASQFYPDTFLGADQFDGVGVHAAQCRRVNRQRWFFGVVARTCSGGQGVSINVIGARDDVQLFRVDVGVDFCRTGDDVELIDIVGVEAIAFDVDTAAIDFETIKLAIAVQHGLTGAEGHTRCIDEAATVTGHAVRVGNDDPRRLACDFGIAVELADATAVDFVKDDACCFAAQLAVAVDITRQLSLLCSTGGVVEDHAFLADVVILELVMRQPRRIGGRNIDHRNAIRGLPHAGVGAAADCNSARRLRPDRLPKHDVDHQQRQRTLGHA